MTQLSQFAPPANQVDLTGNEQTTFAHQWSGNVNRWTETAVLGNPWSNLFDRDRKLYYNPLTTDVANNPISKPIAWTAFPNRILVLFPNATFLEQMGYAEGVHEDGTFGAPPDVQGKAYGPEGPRGWQDEYCEWIATRDAQGNIMRVDFTCENPEYWFSLWRVNPSRVLELYHQLVSHAVKLEDLFLRGSDNNPVIDRATALPTYNPINKWNTQPSREAVTGAVHLISPPNTLSAEIYLAAAATLLREKGGQPVTDPGQLIQCSRYGTTGRNSDPHIGSEVNNIIISGGLMATLQDPVGLYIQTPDFRGYSLPPDPKLPGDAHVAECWQIQRGHARRPDDNIDFILHASFEIPKRWKDAGASLTVSDIKINGNNIKYGAQITQTFQITLRGLAVPTSSPSEKAQPCVTNNPNAIPTPQSVQDLNIFNAGTTSSAVTLIEQGTSVPNIAIFAVNTARQTKISFTGEAGVAVNVTNFQDFPGKGQLFTVTIAVAPTAVLGDRGLQLTNADGITGPAAPRMLSIVAPGTLGKHPAQPVMVAAHFTAQQSPAAHDATIDKWMTYRRNARRASNFS